MSINLAAKRFYEKYKDCYIHSVAITEKEIIVYTKSRCRAYINDYPKEFKGFPVKVKFMGRVKP